MSGLPAEPIVLNEKTLAFDPESKGLKDVRRYIPTLVTAGTPAHMIDLCRFAAGCFFKPAPGNVAIEPWEPTPWMTGANI